MPGIRVAEKLNVIPWIESCVRYDTDRNTEEEINCSIADNGMCSTFMSYRAMYGSRGVGTGFAEAWGTITILAFCGMTVPSVVTEMTRM